MNFTPEQLAARARGIAAADDALARLHHSDPPQPAYDPTYRPAVRTIAPSAPYDPPARPRDQYDPWAHLAGLVCSCPPGCTIGNVWGDGDTPCNHHCRPCREMRGTPYSKPR